MRDIPIVAIQQAVKSFATVLAVDGISFQVQSGEVFALLGPNGAGKSTLVRMIIGMLNPDHGRILWYDKQRKLMPLNRAMIGYLPEDRGLYKNEPVGRILRYFAELHGLSAREATAAANHWLERLEMTQHAKAKLETLSKGNQQKIQVAAALVHNPQLAVLDEPFSGLDPLNQELMMNLIQELRQSGVTILLSAHQLDLVERIANHVLLMNKGREVVSGTVPEIKSGPFGGRSLHLEFHNPISHDAFALMQRDPEVVAVSRTSAETVTLELTTKASILDWTNRAAEQGELKNLSCTQFSLHQIYLRALRENPAVRNQKSESEVMA